MPRKLRVLLVTHRYPPEGLAGVERYTQTLASELTRRGHSAIVVTRQLEPSASALHRRREVEENGVVVHRFVGGDVQLDRFLAHSEVLEHLFEEVLASELPDVVHVNHLLGHSPRVIAAARRRGVALIVTLWDFYFACPLVHLQRLDGRLCAGPDGGRECARTCFAGYGGDQMSRWQARDLYFAELFSLADRVIAPSKYVHDFFRAREPSGVRLRLLEPCTFISRENASVYHPGDGVLRVAFVGALAPHKGPHVVLEALRIARPPSCDLVMFGSVPDSPYAHRLREQAAVIPGVRLRLYGRYEPSDLPCLLRDADCVIVPSLVPETFCFTLHEALACGIPVFASWRGALPEAVIQGVNGHTFNPDEPAELGRLLLSLANDASLRERLHDGARATQLTTPERHLDALLALYEETLAEAARNDHLITLERVDALHHRLRRHGFDVGERPSPFPVIPRPPVTSTTNPTDRSLRAESRRPALSRGGRPPR